MSLPQSVLNLCDFFSSQISQKVLLRRIPYRVRLKKPASVDFAGKHLKSPIILFCSGKTVNAGLTDVGSRRLCRIQCCKSHLKIWTKFDSFKFTYMGGTRPYFRDMLVQIVMLGDTSSATFALFRVILSENRALVEECKVIPLLGIMVIKTFVMPLFVLI